MMTSMVGDGYGDQDNEAGMVAMATANSKLVNGNGESDDDIDGG